MNSSFKHNLATIALAEDNIFDIEYIKSILKINKVICNLNIYRDGQEMLDLLAKLDEPIEINWPDIIILDLNLPKVGGIEILKRIKNNELLEKTPIFILSGSHFEDDITYSYKNGVKFYMHKPFKIDQFIENTEKLENIKIFKGDSWRICRV